MHGHTYRVKLEAVSRQLHPSERCPRPTMVADFKTLRWAKQDMLKGGLDHCVLNEVIPENYGTTAEMIAKFVYDKTKSELPEDVALKVAVSETPQSWATYEDD